MRLIMVAAPDGLGDDVAKVAFAVEIEKVSRRRVESQHRDGKIESRDVVEIETSTPQGKRFIDALLASPFYRREDFSITVKQPRAIISKTSLHELTKPLVEPSIDILEEVWQFSHITVGFAGRVLIAACLLAYGMIEQKILLIIAGLLFLPLLPLLLAVSFGIRAGVGKLVRQGGLAFLTASVLLFLGGAAVAAVTEPPVKYNDFSSLTVSFLISVAVGLAAGLANIDDAGRRELIGLAATAQIALVPVWFGVCAVFGFPASDGERAIIERGASFFLNTLTIIGVTLLVYTLGKAAGGELKKISRE